MTQNSTQTILLSNSATQSAQNTSTSQLRGNNKLNDETPKINNK